MDREQTLRVLNDGLQLKGMSLNPSQEQLFWRFYQEVLEWNDRLNLTAITDAEQVMIKHFIDSLLCLRVVEFAPGMRICDVGSGAGFPGMPLKIMVPGLRLTMLEASKKRVQFLLHLTGVLGISDSEAVHGRAEEWGRTPGWREGFDRVLSRAVASLAVLAEFCLPLTKNGGMMLALKGPGVEEEAHKAMQAIQLLGGKLDSIIDETLPFSGDRRSMVLIRKVSATPEKYPRRPGMPEKRPL